MQLPQGFIDGFTSAVHSLGEEGDRRGADWSAAFQYLKGMLDKFEPEQPKTVAGIRIVVNDKVAPDVIEIHHASGRVEAFRVSARPKP